MNKLEYLFNRVKNTVKKIRKKNPNLDGRKFWQFIKEKLNENDIKFNKWKKLTIYHKNLININEYDNNKNIIELNHFIRQHANIPLNDSSNLTKIIQLALNSGQFLGLANTKIIKEYKYKEKNLGLINTYMKQSDIESISKKISNNLIKEIDEYLNIELNKIK
jgi:hypothetical protein